MDNWICEMSTELTPSIPPRSPDDKLSQSSPPSHFAAPQCPSLIMPVSCLRYCTNNDIWSEDIIIFIGSSGAPHTLSMLDALQLIHHLFQKAILLIHLRGYHNDSIKEIHNLLLKE